MNNDMLPVGMTFHINPEDIKWEWNGGDLISRSALKKSIKSYADDQYAENEYLGEYAIMDIIDKAPAVTVDNYAMGYQDGVRKVLSERPKGEYTEEDMKQAIKENFDIGYEMAKNKYERPQGKWLIEGGTTLHYACSECGCAGDEWDKFCNHCYGKSKFRKSKFCPDCGYLMTKEKNNEES